MSERSYWRKLRGDLDPRGFYVRVENEVDPGTPDVHWCLNAQSGWIENKFFPVVPTRDDSYPLMRHHPILDTQMDWIDEYLERGGRVSILIGVAYKFTLAYPGSLVRRLNECTWRELQALGIEIPAKSRINPLELP